MNLGSLISAVFTSGALLLATVSNTGCATAQTFEAKVRSRAAFDLDCSEVQLTKLSGGVYGVQGCGEKAAYVLVAKSEQACSRGAAKLHADRDCSRSEAASDRRPQEPSAPPLCVRARNHADPGDRRQSDIDEVG